MEVIAPTIYDHLTSPTWQQKKRSWYEYEFSAIIEEHKISTWNIIRKYFYNTKRNLNLSTTQYETLHPSIKDGMHLTFLSDHKPIWNGELNILSWNVGDTLSTYRYTFPPFTNIIFNEREFEIEYESIRDDLLKEKSKLIAKVINFHKTIRKPSPFFIINLQECSRRLYNLILDILNFNFPISGDFHSQGILHVSKFNYEDILISGRQLVDLIEKNGADCLINYDIEIKDNNNLDTMGFSTFIIYENIKDVSPIKLIPNIIYNDTWRSDENNIISKYTVNNYGVGISCRSCLILSKSLPFIIYNVHLKNDKYLVDKIHEEIQNMLNINPIIFDIDTIKLNYKINYDKGITNKDELKIFFNKITKKHLPDINNKVKGIGFNKKHVVIAGDFNLKFTDFKIDPHLSKVKDIFDSRIDHIIEKKEDVKGGEYKRKYLKYKAKYIALKKAIYLAAI
jgi:hypothetical protein